MFAVMAAGVVLAMYVNWVYRAVPVCGGQPHWQLANETDLFVLLVIVIAATAQPVWLQRVAALFAIGLMVYFIQDFMLELPAYPGDGAPASQGDCPNQ